MYYNGDYNNYRKPEPKPKKNKSSTPLVALVFILIIVIIVLSCAILYTRTVDKYELQLAAYGDLINEYKSEFEDYEKSISALNGKVSNLSDVADNLESDMQKLSSSDNSSSLGEINIADTAARVSPSVIGIKIYVPAQNVNSFWYTQAIESEGSGIILTEDGYIVTNYHVVSYAAQYDSAVITVILSDETEHIAEYIGGDEINDLAIIKINAKNLPYATLGSSDKSQTGDFVMAIGNPLGVNLYGSVTLGIISGVNRKIEAENVAEKLIQTDAAINPGNSGGALFNMKGEVIGINTVKISKSNVEGIGFAIPIDYAKPLIESIIKYGYVKDRPTLGVSGTDVSSSMARVYGIPRGLYVEEIDRYSDAGAEIREGDIITEIDGVSVYTLTEIANIVKMHKVGDKITVTVWRSGSYYNLSVVLTEQK